MAGRGKLLKWRPRSLSCTTRPGTGGWGRALSAGKSLATPASRVRTSGDAGDATARTIAAVSAGSPVSCHASYRVHDPCHLAQSGSSRSCILTQNSYSYAAWCQRDHWEREHKGTCISAPKPEGFRSEQQVVVIRDTHTPGGTEHLAGELVVFEKEDAYGWTYVRDARGSTHWLQSSALAAATRALGAAAQASTDIDSDAMHQMPDIAPANGNGASDKMRFRSEQQVVVIHDTHTPEGKLHLAGELVVFEKEDAHGWTSVRDASGMRCWLPSSALEAAVADGK